MSPDATQRAPFTERQRFLVEALEQKHAELGRRYRGAIISLSDSRNPDRLALAAHGLRELSDELTKFYDLPLMGERPGLTEQVRGLSQSWAKVKQEAAECSGVCGSCVGGRLRKFLDRLERFFDNFLTLHPRRRDRALQAVRTIDVNQRRREQEQEEQMVNDWIDLHDYFNQCAHHREKAEPDILRRLSAFEDLLLKLLHPRPSEDLSAIDQLFREENENALG